MTTVYKNSVKSTRKHNFKPGLEEDNKKLLTRTRLLFGGGVLRAQYKHE